jgi:hypothetical protein
LLRDGRGVLVDLSGGAGLAGLEAAVAGHRDRVTVAVADAPGDGGALLVRPDGYVAWASAAPHPAGLDEALTTWFGPAT